MGIGKRLEDELDRDIRRSSHGPEADDSMLISIRV